MTDLRVLAMALMGWFLALAVGLLLGSSLSTPDRRDRAYEGLRREFELLRTENQRVQGESASLRRQADASDQALDDLTPDLIKGRLTGAQVGVILCGPEGEAALGGELERTIRATGAEIGPVLRIPDQPRLLSDSDRNRIRSLFGLAPTSGEPDPFEPALLAVRGMINGAPPERLQELVSTGSLDLRGYTGRALRRAVLLTGGDEERAKLVRDGDTPEVALVNLARESGIRLVAAERRESEPLAAFLHRRGVPSVDNVDRAAGRLAVVLTLAGADGSFGFKPGAGRAIPQLKSD